MTPPTRLPFRRRVIASVLGGATLLILALALWQVGRAGTQQEAAAVTFDSTTVPTTVAMTVLTTPSTTTPPPSTTASTSTTTTTAVPTSSTDPPTTTTTLAPLVLEGDGLDVVSFGVTPEETIGEVAARLGPVTSDSGWVNARGNFGTCPGSIVRVIRWESLRAFFSDGPTDFGEDQQHFFYYSQSSADTAVVIDLTTERGIGIGSTVEDLTEAYGDRVEIESTVPFGVTFVVETGGPGLLSGTLTESVPDGQVTSVAGGFGCGS